MKQNKEKFDFTALGLAIKAVNGLRVEIFVRKYYLPIDSLDRWNGDKRTRLTKKLQFVA